jgi:small subunit ribosomal protein S3
MGRKVHPIGFRLGVIRTWDSRWYAEGSTYADQLHGDLAIRELIEKSTPRGAVSRVEIEPSQTMCKSPCTRPSRGS